MYAYVSDDIHIHSSYHPCHGIGFQGNIYRKVTFPGSKTRISPAIFPSGGDVLYIPRGFVHEASTENHASLHVTLAIPTFVSWLEPG